ncbi:hypothetical protein DMUE_0606 [Dictyocoela muelleri]|nr:hypothetical protein DMUE_0606 [Dictyocoela muelleri]
MRIFKYSAIKGIIEKCAKNFNFCYNTAVNKIPMKIVKEYKNGNENFIKNIKEKNWNVKIENLKKINKKRKKYNFYNGQSIFLKNTELERPKIFILVLLKLSKHIKIQI